jgi:tetratricopeptide (TPR) repeat protein
MPNQPPSPQEITDQARQAYQAGDYGQAAQLFADAASAYAAAGLLPTSAEMKNNQSVALLLAGNAQSALDAVEGTDKIFVESGDFRRQGMALANQASALQALKRTRDAIECYKRAGDVLEQANEGDLRAEVMQLLSTLYFRRFKLYDAIITLQSGLAGVKDPTPKQRLMKKILFIRL